MVTALSSPARQLAEAPDSWRVNNDRAVDWLGRVGAFWSWRDRARCKDEDSSLFFAPEGERGLPRRRREWAAKEVCAACEVRDFCAGYALANREPYGIWGGLTEAERERIWSAEEADARPFAPGLQDDLQEAAR